MKCNHCGKEIANDSVFCEFCGTRTINATGLTKKIDLRWCLLPTMIVTSICMTFTLHDFTLVYHGWGETSYYPLALAIVLFIVSVIFGFRKELSISFIILMGLYLTSNCCMMYAARHTTCHHHDYCVWIEWYDKTSQKTNTCRLEDEIYNEEDLVARQEYIYDALKNYGAKNLTKSETLGECNCFYSPGFGEIEGLYLRWSSLFLYLVYALIARKKNWRF